MPLALAALAGAAALEPGAAGRPAGDTGAGELALAIVARLLLAAFFWEMAGWRHVTASPVRVGVVALWLVAGPVLAWRQRGGGRLAMLRPVQTVSYVAAALLAFSLPDPLLGLAQAMLALGLATVLRGAPDDDLGLWRGAAARGVHACAVAFLALPLLGLGR